MPKLFRPIEQFIKKIRKNRLVPSFGAHLSHVLVDAGIKLLDIGARQGPFSQLTLLAPYAHYFACEPDQKELGVLLAKLKEEAPWKNVTLIPEAISSTGGERTLFIAKHPGYSSLLQPNDPVVDRYNMNHFFAVQSTVPVQTISLDRAAERYGFQDACFIKLDTEGTELDILQSGKKLLEESLLGVYVEGKFHHFYKGQPLFSDIDSFLRSFDFSLFDLYRSFHRRSSYQSDLYSKAQAVWAHALYLKEPEVILETDSVNQRLRASRLLALALAFEHFDLAIELVSNRKTTHLFSTYGEDEVREEIKRWVRNRTKAALKMNRHRRLPHPTDEAYTDKIEE